jgi:BASS family bile acid:Na+ symporter
MPDVLGAVSNLSVQIFAIASMGSIGLRYSVEEIIGPLRNVWAIVLALLANSLRFRCSPSRFCN